MTEQTDLVPKRRFKKFLNSHDWEQRKLGNVSISYSGGTPLVGKNDYYNGDIPFIRSAEIKSNRTELTITKTGLNNSSAKLVEKGDILYALYGATSGEVGISRINGAINQAILAIMPDEGYDSQFIMQWLRAQKQKIIDKYLQGGQGNLSGSIVKELDIKFPNYDEQMRIGQFFKQLDHLITLHQRKLEKTKELKSAYLSEMFPAEGEREPKRRFAGFTGAWEQREVQWLIDEGIIEEPMDGNHGEKHPTASEYVDYGIPFLMATDIKNGLVDFKKCNFITTERSKKLDKGFAKNGDVLITHKATIGEVAILSGLSSEYAVLTPQVTYYRVIDKSKLAIKYLYAYFNSPDFQNSLKLEATQSTRAYIGITGQRKLDIMFPKAIKEQEKIGEYFSDLDNLINLHQRKLEKLQNLKEAFLNEMFV
ncbi:restriction endonuclease subunit S [Paenibacillus sp. KS-LC4]|uniref:restriction endonuclease subunit S n=1 Tax=Paenibacillus sp. KS-LC4 TaxID=2979727 RepID=UPI0030CAC226